MVIGLGACMEWGLVADLEGPEVLASSLDGPRTLEVPVAATLVIEFSEALDPASVGPGALALVPWETVGSCDRTPECTRGSCERGRCQVDPLTETAMRRIDRGVYVPEVALRIELGPGEAGDDARLTITPEVALAPRSRYSLVLGAGIRDPSGAPLEDGSGRRGRWRRDFVTGSAGSSGPEAGLLTPTVGELVPRNLARVRTRFPRPVDGAAGASLELLASAGAPGRLIAPEPCPGWVPGFCLDWRVDPPLAAGVAYRLGGGSLVDRRGRAAVVPHTFEWFVASAAEDLVAPDAAAVAVELRGRCVHARAPAGEPLTFRLTLAPGGGGQVVTATATGSGAEALEVAIAVPAGFWPAEASATGLLGLTIEVEDRAGNRGEREAALPLPGPAPLPIAIAEVLANPAGPEPAQEFVELLDVRGDGDPLAIDGLRIADRPPIEVLEALEQGGLPGQAIPAFTSLPGQRTVIVGERYAFGEPSDPDPPADAVVLRVTGTLGASGLSNSGEPLAVFDGASRRMIATYAEPVAVQKAADNGRSVVNEHHGGCDLASAWRTHPLGLSSPGWAP